MANKQRVIALTRKLISIDSQNPPGGERRIASFIKGYLQGVGLRSRIYEFRKGRSNLVAVLPGRDKRRSLLLTPHLDTVPAGQKWRHTPLQATLVGKRLYGLGATDCKGNLACALEAITSLIEEGAVLNYNLILAATADEESGSGLGLIPLLEKGIIRPCLALVLDSDDFNIIVAQKGLLHLKVKIEGKRAHGAYPWRGVNAIDTALKILTELKKRKVACPRSKYLRMPTLNIGTIRGGDKVNVVADWCEFELDYRFLPGMTHEGILRDLRQTFSRHASRFKLEINGIQRPYLIDKGHPLVRCLAESMRSLNLRPRIRGSEGATVITFFQERKIPAIATGFGSGACAHCADEYVRVDNLYRGAEALEKFLKDFNF